MKVLRMRSWNIHAENWIKWPSSTSKRWARK